MYIAIESDHRHYTLWSDSLWSDSLWSDIEYALVCVSLPARWSQVRGDFIASLQLSSYSNPSHRHARGGCCDFSYFFFSCGNCDNYFVVCVESLCRHTGYVGNGETLRFGASVGDVPNPLTFSVPGVYTVSGEH